ncbi:MAG: ParA family protein [Chitinophagaceae bacterium]|nr:MAG: ParA family protein [Chitinophagaceae bacterium]
MAVVSIAVQKGGSGKTTTAVNLAAAFHRLGKKVLLLDADPQCNLTQALGISEETENNLYTEFKKEIIGKKSDLRSAIVTTRSGLDLIPSSIDLALTEQELVGKFNREETLRNKMLKPLVNEYDFIFIDCPPSFGLITVNALVASDHLIIPLQAEFLPLKGVYSFLRLLEMMKDIGNMNLSVAGFVLTRYSQHKKLNQEIKSLLENEFRIGVFGSFIRTDIRLAVAQKHGLDIFSYAPASNGAKDYALLAKELLSKLEPADAGPGIHSILKDHPDTIGISQ